MSNKNSLRVAVIGGDGTGPEVAAEGVKVLQAVAKLEGFQLEAKNYDLGGDRYLKTGEILPPAVIEELRTFPAILLAQWAIPTWPRAFWKKACSWNCDFASISTSTSAR